MASKRFSDMKTPHLECRVWNHQWDHQLTVVGKEANVRVFELRLRCRRCRVQRIDRIRARDAERLGRRYQGYPVGYLVEDPASWGGRKELNRNSLLELISRLK